MNARQKPYSPVLTVAEFFGAQDSYMVPAYQRGYAWGNSQVSDLLDDLQKFDQSSDLYYTLGQVIVSPGEDRYTWSLVDGQQRSTTLYLLILAGYMRTKKLSDLSQNHAFRVNAVANILHFASGGGFFPRLRAAGDGNDFIELLLNGQGLPRASSANQLKIKEAFDQLDEGLDSSYESPEEILEFLEKILYKVYLTRLEMDNQKQALRVFEKINDRGLALTSADLMKNLLFQGVEENEFELISESWKIAGDSLFLAKNSRARSMEFLMKALIAIRTGKSIPNSQVYDEWELQLQGRAEAITFANELPAKAAYMTNLASGKNVKGQPSPVTYGTTYFNMVQHYQLLMAGAHLSEKSYGYLAEIVEERSIMSLLSKEKSQDFERMLPKWSLNISNLHFDASREDIFRASKTALDEAESLIAQAGIHFGSWTYSSLSHRKKIKYFLARIAQATQQEITSVGPNSHVIGLEEYLRSTTKSSVGYDIEHVLPNSSPQMANWEKSRDSAFINSIGNLTLLHPTDNRSAGNSLPEEKAASYASSTLLINKVLCADQELGLLTNRISAVVKKLHEICPPDLSSWGEEQVAARQDLYWEIFRADSSKKLGLNN